MPLKNKKWVVVDGIQHFAIDGSIICDNSLNKFSWNTTEPKSVCKYCKKTANVKMKTKQLNLF